eukprot:g3797.t1
MYYAEDAFHPGGGRGIYAFEHAGRGRLRQLHEPFDAGCNPTFLATNPAGDVLLACNEGGPDDADANTLTAFRIDRATGALCRAGRAQPSGGHGPCFVSVTPCGGFALVAHYHTGTVGVLPLLADGSLGPVAATWGTAAMAATAGEAASGPPAHVRAERPHAHSAYALPAPAPGAPCPILVLDLGLDLVLGACMDTAAAAGGGAGRAAAAGGVAAGGLSAAHAVVGARMPPVAAAAPGSVHPVHGPRHLAFHPGDPGSDSPVSPPRHRFAFVANELSASLSVCALDPGEGRSGCTLLPLCTLSALPPGFVRPPPAVWGASPVPERCAAPAAVGGVSHCAHVE